MQKIKSLSAVAVLLLFTYGIFAQTEPKNSASIPIEIFNSKYLFIKLTVNNQKELDFYFDTGATTSLLNKQAADALHIEPSTEHDAEGSGGTLKYPIAEHQKVNINNIEVDSVDFIIDDLSYQISELGRHFDGIIGYALLITNRYQYYQYDLVRNFIWLILHVYC